MDRLIRTAWKAFWVGLGASAVLISQSFLAPAPAASESMPSANQASPVAPAATTPSRAKSADPILSRNPFDSSAKGRKLTVRGNQS